MYSVKSRSGRRGTVLTNYAHDMTRLMLRAPISWFSSGPVSNVKMGRNVRQRAHAFSETRIARPETRIARDAHRPSIDCPTELHCILLLMRACRFRLITFSPRGQMLHAFTHMKKLNSKRAIRIARRAQHGIFDAPFGEKRASKKLAKPV